MAMGTAAGTAAAIAAKKGLDIREVEHGELTEALRRLGATVPEND